MKDLDRIKKDNVKTQVEAPNYGIISGSTKTYDGTSHLNATLNDLKFKFIELKGKWEGKEETSFMVFNIPKHSLIRLGHTFGQNAVIHKEGNKVTLYLKGRTEIASSILRTKYSKDFEDDYSELDGIRFKFDF